MKIVYKAAVWRYCLYLSGSSLAVGPKEVTISGPDSLEIGVTASFTCSAECSPSCSFTWTLYGKNVTGSVIDITVNRHVSKESISCWAENTFTGKTVTVSETLSVSGRPLSVFGHEFMSDICSNLTVLYVLFTTDPHWCGCWESGKKLALLMLCTQWSTEIYSGYFLLTTLYLLYLYGYICSSTVYSDCDGLAT